jgi:hypothetical protein
MEKERTNMKYYIYTMIFDCGYQSQEVWASSVKAGGIGEAIDKSVEEEFDEGSCPDCPSIIVQIDIETGRTIKEFRSYDKENQIEATWDKEVKAAKKIFTDAWGSIEGGL